MLNKVYRPKIAPKVFLFLIIAGLVGLLLAGCGANPPTQLPPTVNPATPNLAATATPTGIAATTRPADGGNTPTAPAPSYKPIIRFSAQTIELGGTLTVSGSGYPPNQKVYILVGEGIQEWSADTTARTTDASGNFSVSLKLEADTYNRPLQAGQVLIQATTSTSADGVRYAAGAKVNLNVMPPKPPAYQPLLRVTTPAQVGTEVSLSGSGYPPDVDLQLLGGYNPDGGGAVLVNSVRTDANGTFVKKLRLVGNDGTNLKSGTFVIVARTANLQVSTSLVINLNE
jgi:hypothetical protein